jgi:hypothetical protein
MRFQRVHRNTGDQPSVRAGFNRFGRRRRPFGRGTPSGGRQDIGSPVAAGAPARKPAGPVRMRAIQSATDLRDALLTREVEHAQLSAG